MTDDAHVGLARYHYGRWSWVAFETDGAEHGWRTVEIEAGDDGVELRVWDGDADAYPEQPTLVFTDETAEAMLRACLDHVEASMSTVRSLPSSMHDRARRLTLMREGMRMCKLAIEQETDGGHDLPDEPF